MALGLMGVNLIFRLNMPVHLTAFVKVLGRLVYRFQCVGLNQSLKS